MLRLICWILGICYHDHKVVKVIPVAYNGDEYSIHSLDLAKAGKIKYIIYRKYCSKCGHVKHQKVAL